MSGNKSRIAQMLEEAAGLPQEEPVSDQPADGKLLGVLPESVRELHALWRHCQEMYHTAKDTMEALQDQHSAVSPDLERSKNILLYEYVLSMVLYRREARRAFGVEGENIRLWLCKGWEVYSTPAPTQACILTEFGLVADRDLLMLLCPQIYEIMND